MTLKECYRTLELPKTADLEEVKKAYRRLAFSLHPDLNPGMPDAARRFQEVNEAYVLLTKTLQDETRRDPRVQHRKPPEKPQTQSQTQTQPQTHTRAKSAQAKAAQDAAKGAASQAGAGKTAASGGRHGFAGSTGPAADKPRPGSTAGCFGQTGPRAAQYGPASPGTGRAGDFNFNRESGNIFSGTDNAGTISGSRPASDFDAYGRDKNVAGSAYGREEEVLGEILNDPFARRVFEDIYSELKKERGPASAAAPINAPKPKKKKKISLEWGKNKMSVDLTHGFVGAIKSWLRGQLDQEQVLEMPGAGIVPGARIRLQVDVGIFGHNQSVEITLPPEYLPGTPIRLKGLGRKLGSWRGDLYLRVVPQGSGNI